MSRINPVIIFTSIGAGASSGRALSHWILIGIAWLLALTIVLPQPIAYSQILAAYPPIDAVVDRVAASYPPTNKYLITRNGKRIGTHQLNFTVSGSEVDVSIESKIRVRILGITVYALDYIASEKWRNNQLVFATATTTENKKSNTVTYQQADAIAEAQFASNHWHPGVLRTNSLFNTLTGEVEDVEIEALGSDQIELGGVPIQSLHFRYGYEDPVESWYDLSGRWLQLKFSAKDKSIIRYSRAP